MDLDGAQFPPTLKSLHELPFDNLDREGIEFEPYDQFLSAEETTSWLRAWTGTESFEAANYRIFGQDGAGGLAAFWLVRPTHSLLDQPIVFFGSEGELGVVAENFWNYLWLLACEIGPYEAIAYGAGLQRQNAAFRAFALEHAPDNERPAQEIIESARREFPTFESDFRNMCA